MLQGPQGLGAACAGGRALKPARFGIRTFSVDEQGIETLRYTGGAAAMVQEPAKNRIRGPCLCGQTPVETLTCIGGPGATCDSSALSVQACTSASSLLGDATGPLGPHHVVLAVRPLDRTCQASWRQG